MSYKGLESGEANQLSSPLLTVVMSCYNQAAYVRQAIESVLMQKTDFPVRLIITDDHSTKDDSVAIIREYAAKYPDRITALLNDENGRYLKNVLRAMELVKSEYFTLLDADDYWTDDRYLADAVAYLESRPDYTVYGRNIEWRKEDGSHGVQCAPDVPDTEFDFDSFLSSGHVTPLTPSAVFRNVIFREGVPAFLTAAVGTDLECPFNGDVFRFLQHLVRGRYRFENKVSGVYRMVGGGIFIGMSPVARDLIQAFCYVAYSRHFGRGDSWFLPEAQKCLERACAGMMEAVRAGHPVEGLPLRALEAVTKFLAEHREQMAPPVALAKAAWGDRLRLKMWKKLSKRLARRGLLRIDSRWMEK